MLLIHFDAEIFIMTVNFLRQATRRLSLIFADLRQTPHPSQRLSDVSVAWGLLQVLRSITASFRSMNEIWKAQKLENSASQSSGAKSHDNGCSFVERIGHFAACDLAVGGFRERLNTPHITVIRSYVHTVAFFQLSLNIALNLSTSPCILKFFPEIIPATQRPWFSYTSVWIVFYARISRNK